MGGIYPTGNCFSDALEFMRDRFLFEPGAWLNYLLVHAKIHEADGTERSHAWVEEAASGRVWTAGICDGERVFVSVDDRQQYYDFVQAHDITRYSMQEVRDLSKRHGPPPWEARYLDLCVRYPGDRPEAV